MKKVLLIAALAFASLTNAQDLKSKRGEAFLPEAGDWAIGFNAGGLLNYVGNAFNGTSGNSASLSAEKDNAFVGKKFITDNTAYRVVANLGFNSNTETSSQNVPNALIDLENKITGFNFQAGLGKEWRRGSTRLQGFYGADVLVSLNSATTTKTETTTIEKVELNPTYPKVYTSKTEEKQGLGFGFGVQGFVGAEYFIFPKIAVGVQYTYGLGLDFGGKHTKTITRPDLKNHFITETITEDLGKTTRINLGNVNVTSLNLTLHF